MIGYCNFNKTYDKDALKCDLKIIKKEINKLSMSDREIVLREYINNISGCCIDIREYNAFVSLFNDCY
jgi:hypothetical protein